MTDSITVIRAHGRRLAKLIRADGGIEDYEGARLVDLVERDLTGLEDIGRLLVRLQARPDVAVVRGSIADPARTRSVRRLLHADVQTGELPTLVEVPRRWVAFDFDSIDRPDAVDVNDLEVCAEIAVALLPPAFRYAAAVIQATASHAIKPGIRLRLWHWLDRRVDGNELKFWMRRVPVDPATLRAAQLTYTARPVLAPGASDPLPARLAWRVGAPMVRVPPPRELQSTPTQRAAPPPQPATPGSGNYAATMLTQALVRIGRAGVGQRNPTLFAAACGLAPLIKHRLLDEDTVTAALTGAARWIGIDGEPRRDAEREAKKAVAWALTHLSAGRAS
jgi:hypothetical protein